MKFHQETSGGLFVSTDLGTPTFSEQKAQLHLGPDMTILL